MVRRGWRRISDRRGRSNERGGEAGSQPSNGDSVLVIGAGVGGLLTAMSMARDGAAVTVVERDPQRVLDVAAGIAAYEVPEGFGEPMAARLLGFSLVGYEGADGRSHIYLIQAPRILPLDRAALETQVAQVGARDLHTRLTVVEERPCRIGEEETTLIISEGRSGDDVPYRSASALFNGRGGTALVNVAMPVASWDEAAVEALLASLDQP